MSADDQRAAEEERAVRSWLTDIVEDEPEGAYEGHTYEEVRDATRALALLDRLRAELADRRAELHGATGAAAVLRERGDALADAKNWVGHVVEAEQWRSVRGDAPAEPPADGPDTELAEQRLRAWLTSAPGLVADVGGDLRPVLDELDRLRAVLARPAAGRDLTADDVFEGLVELGFRPRERKRREQFAARLNEVARPAVARTDGQCTCGDPSAADLVHHTEAPCRTAEELRTGRTDGQPPAEHPRERAIEPIKIRLESACYCDDQPSAREIIDAIRSAGLDIVAAPADDTAAPGPIETAARQLYAAIVAEHQRGETFPMRVSVCTNGLREALGETYPDDAPAAGQSVRDSQGRES